MTILTGAGVEEVMKATATGVSAKIKGKDGKVGSSREDSPIASSPSASSPIPKISGWRRWASKWTAVSYQTDPMCRTNVPGLWAIGDITAPPWLAHKASHEGVIAAEAIAGGHPHAMDPKNIPGCTYCHPQVASVGMTEAKAKEAGYDVKVGNFPFIGNGKAIALGEAEGFIKTVFDAKTGELLGAHMVGAEVTELIQGYTIGKTAELVEADFMHTVFPHPTLSEMMHESCAGGLWEDAAYVRELKWRVSQRIDSSSLWAGLAPDRGFCFTDPLSYRHVLRPLGLAHQDRSDPEHGSNIRCGRSILGASRC